MGTTKKSKHTDIPTSSVALRGRAADISEFAAVWQKAAQKADLAAQKADDYESAQAKVDEVAAEAFEAERTAHDAYSDADSLTVKKYR